MRHGDHEDREWTAEAIAREAERWTWWPEAAAVTKDDRRLLVHMPRHWGRSVVWRSSVADEDRARALIEETVAEVRAAGGTRLVWHTGDMTRPTNTGELLTQRGFELSQRLEILAFELGEVSLTGLPELAVPDDVAVGPARDLEGLKDTYRISSRVFSSAIPSEAEITGYARDLERLEDRERGGASDGPLTIRFLALVGEGDHRRAIASAGLQLVGEVGRLWGGGTLEHFRGRGAYRALVLERCRMARDLGATLALVKADVGTTGPILKRAGFQVAGTERRYAMEVLAS